MIRRLAAGLASAAAAVLVAPAAFGASDARPLLRMADPRITEASGIARGIASPGVLYVHNDSGDPARFFAIDAHSGSTLATFTVPEATNVDWEDIAVAPDARGVPSVWLADIGDNAAGRDEVRLYRVDEPTVDLQGRGVPATTRAPDVWRLRSPDGTADAESLAVAPGGAAYVFTKSVLGVTNAYRVPARADATRTHEMTPIATIRFSLTGTPGGPNIAGQLTATGAALSRGGTLLAIRTYTDAYVWDVRGGDVAAALTASPRRIALPDQPQGEGIAVDGGRLLLSSEGADSIVWSVPLPAAASAAPSSHGVSSPGTSALTPSPGRSENGRSGAAKATVAGGLVVLAVAAALATGVRRHRAPRRGI